MAIGEMGRNDPSKFNEMRIDTRDIEKAMEKALNAVAMRVDGFKLKDHVGIFWKIYRVAIPRIVISEGEVDAAVDLYEVVVGVEEDGDQFSSCKRKSGKEQPHVAKKLKKLVISCRLRLVEDPVVMFEVKAKIKYRQAQDVMKKAVEAGAVVDQKITSTPKDFH